MKAPITGSRRALSLPIFSLEEVTISTLIEHAILDATSAIIVQLKNQPEIREREISALSSTAHMTKDKKMMDDFIIVRLG